MLCLLFISVFILTSYVQYTEEGSIFDSNESEEAKLCKRLKIDCPAFGTGWAQKDKNDKYEGCFKSMEKTLQWLPYSTIEQIIYNYGNEGSWTEIGDVERMFKEKSWSKVENIQKLCKFLYSVPNGNIDFLRELLAVKYESWWESLLDNKTIQLKEIYVQLIKDKDFLDMFEIYLTWMKKTPGCTCDESNLVEISAFNIKKRFDDSSLEKLFASIAKCDSASSKRYNKWDKITMKSLFEKPFIQNAELDYIEFVLQHCAILPRMVFAKNELGWDLQDIIDTLRKDSDPKIIQVHIDAYVIAINIWLKKSLFDTIFERARKENVEVDFELFFSQLQSLESHRIESGSDETYIEVFLFLAFKLEVNYTKLKEPFETDNFIRTCIVNKFNIKFMYTFMKTATESGVSLYTFKPFVYIACESINCKYGDAKVSEQKIFQVMKVFFEINTYLMSNEFWSNIWHRVESDYKNINVYELVLIYNRQKTVAANAIYAYLINLKEHSDAPTCPGGLLEGLMYYSARCQWSQSNLIELYDLTCKKTQYMKDMIKKVTELQNRHCKKIISDIKDFIYDKERSPSSSPN